MQGSANAVHGLDLKKEDGKNKVKEGSRIMNTHKNTRAHVQTKRGVNKKKKESEANDQIKYIEKQRTAKQQQRRRPFFFSYMN